MGRSSNKPTRFTGGGGTSAPAPEEASIKRSVEYEQKQLEMLLNQKPRPTWEEYKERHKDQLEDRMGMGVEREQLAYRRMLDAERNSKVGPTPCSSKPGYVFRSPLGGLALSSVGGRGCFHNH